MNRFLNVKCGTDARALTKVGQCAAFEGTPAKLVFTPLDASYEVSSSVAFTTSLDLDLATAKAVAINDGIVNLEVSGGDTRTSQEGFGAAKSLGWNPYVETYTINEGGLCLLRQLMKLDGTDVRMFVVDDAGVIYGESVENGQAIRGYRVNLGVSRRANTGTETGAIRVMANYSLRYFQEVANIAATRYEGEDFVTVLGFTIKKDVGSAETFIVVDSCSGEPFNPAIITYVNGNVHGFQIDPTTLEKVVLPLALGAAPAKGQINLTGAVDGRVTGIAVTDPNMPVGTGPDAYLWPEDWTVIA